MNEKTSPRMLNGHPQQHVSDKMPKISPAVEKELVLGNWPAVEVPGFSGPITGGIGGAKCPANSGCAERVPFRRAGSERWRLRVGAAFGNPLPQLPGGCRAVFSAVHSNDFIHTR